MSNNYNNNKEIKIGDKFGFWTVIDDCEKSKYNHKQKICKCICGKISIIRDTILRNGRSSSCGCNGKYQVMGNRYGKLVCISNGYHNSDISDRILVDVKCDCGNKKTVLFQSLDSGATRSCGCLVKETRPSGENHPRWNSSLSDIDRIHNNSRGSISGYQTFRKHVVLLNNNTCQCCGFSKENNMRVHHITSWNICDDDSKMSITNAILLCPFCHDIVYLGSFHNLYGNGNNTPEQLEQYINSRRKELNIDIPFSLDSYLSGNILKPGDVDAPWIFDTLSIKSDVENNCSKIAI